MVIGRFAPSPTGNLHIGNLRTALLAFWSVKSAGGRFLVRFEDLDRVTSSRERAMTQLADLAKVGVEPDEEPVFQSDRFDLYVDAISTLTQKGLTYECYCSRKDVRDAAQAPHGENVVYPGTCREFTDKQRELKRQERPAALRLRAQEHSYSFTDLFVGRYEGPVDDVVLQRNDGVPSYNVAVVVDDAIQGVTEVVRGDDLLWSTPTHMELQRLLDIPAVTYRHVPLVVGADGERLAKRHGAVTLDDLISAGVNIDDVLIFLQQNSGLRGGEFLWERVVIQQLKWDSKSFGQHLQR